MRDLNRRELERRIELFCNSCPGVRLQRAFEELEHCKMNIHGEVTYMNTGALLEVSKFIELFKRSDDENGAEENERD